MGALLPAALGCISLGLCLLQLPGCRALPVGRPLLLPRDRESQERRPTTLLGSRPPQRRMLQLLRLGTARAQLDWERREGVPAALPWPFPEPRSRAGPPGLSWTGPSRAKRHAAPRRHHPQLMRVGCVLGTCQVQNLGHRLWQLMGQSGLQDSSPMNPSSPHSYG